MKEARFFEVGGCVRDRLMGLAPKDIDYSVEAESFEAMRQAILARGGEIFPIPNSEAFLTIRAKVPQMGGACDFVLCRKDGTYNKDGRRPDFVEVGTLADDLARRDFTVNAMAINEEGELIDLYRGQEDLAKRLLRCVGLTEKRMKEDSLRMLRALRFSLIKGFTLAPELEAFLLNDNNVELLNNISIERIREELYKCFEFNTLETLQMLEKFWRIRNHIFSRNLSLKPAIFVLK